jgi:4-amino-4-deoxy-L-arabinose transferase-like glycosyltransferase
MGRVNLDWAYVCGILLVALALRVWGINYDLPYIYHADEPIYVTIVQNMFRTGDLNPHFFNYPSLFFYINLLAYIPYYLLGKLLGIFTSHNDISSPVMIVMGTTHALLPSAILLGRSITLLFGIGTVGLTFMIGKLLTGDARVGLLAALMLSISPTNVSHSRLITPDTFVVFFTTATLLSTVLIYQQGKLWHYIVAGISAGLTASSKYNGALIVLPLFFAHLLRWGKAAFKTSALYVALLFCVLAFFLTTPFALIDPKFWSDLRYEAQHYATGHPGMEGDTVRWYLDYMWQSGGIIYILAVLEILRGILLRSKEIILLSVFPLAYFIFIASFVVRNDRTFLPMTPLLFVLSASFWIYLWDKARRFSSQGAHRLMIVVLACLLGSGLFIQLSNTITNTVRLTTINSRETARIWLSENLPIGARIALESYSPFLDPARFSVQGFGRMIDHSPEWYIANQFDYLIFSQGMYGRFYREPEKYSKEVSQYDALFNRFTLLKKFMDGDFEVRVYRVK